MICANATEAGIFTDGGYSEQMWVKDAVTSRRSAISTRSPRHRSRAAA